MFTKLLSFTDVILHLGTEFWLLLVHSGLLYQLSSRGWQAVLFNKWHQRNSTVKSFAWHRQDRDQWSEWVLGEFAMCNVLLLCYFCLTNVRLGLLDYRPFRVRPVLVRLLVSPSFAWLTSIQPIANVSLRSGWDRKQRCLKKWEMLCTEQSPYNPRWTRMFRVPEKHVNFTVLTVLAEREGHPYVN